MIDCSICDLLFHLQKAKLCSKFRRLWFNVEKLLVAFNVSFFVHPHRDLRWNGTISRVFMRWYWKGARVLQPSNPPSTSSPNLRLILILTSSLHRDQPLLPLRIGQWKKLRAWWLYYWMDDARNPNEGIFKLLYKRSYVVHEWDVAATITYIETWIKSSIHAHSYA